MNDLKFLILYSTIGIVFGFCGIYSFMTGSLPGNKGSVYYSKQPILWIVGTSLYIVLSLVGITLAVIEIVK